MISWDSVFPFWNTLSDLQQSELLDNTIIRQYSEGEGIKKRHGIYIVSEGGLLVYIVHASGRKRILLQGKESELIILTFEFLNASENMSLELRAKKDSEIYFIPFEAWDKFQERCPEAQNLMIETLSKHLFALSTSLYEGMENIGKQLAMFLLRSIDPDAKECEIRISHEELAEQLGTTREVITRNISILKQLGFLETGRNRIQVVNPSGLQTYIEQEID